MRVRLHNGYTQAYAQIMQHTHTHKAVTGRVEAKKLLSRRRQLNYSEEKVPGLNPGWSLVSKFFHCCVVEVLTIFPCVGHLVGTTANFIQRIVTCNSCAFCDNLFRVSPRVLAMSSSLPDAAVDVAVSLLDVVLVVLPEGAVLDD